jgi:hypothetical protein
MAQWIQWHVTLLIDGVEKAGEVGLACGLLNRMNEKNVVAAPRTCKGRWTLGGLAVLSTDE